MMLQSSFVFYMIRYRCNDNDHDVVKLVCRTCSLADFSAKLDNNWTATKLFGTTINLNSIQVNFRCAVHIRLLSFVFVELQNTQHLMALAMSRLSLISYKYTILGRTFTVTVLTTPSQMFWTWELILLSGEFLSFNSPTYT